MLLLCYISICLSGCVGRSRLLEARITIDSLKSENVCLLKENEELLNGEERLTNQYRLNVSRGNYILAEENYHNLVKYHPGAISIEKLKESIDDVLDKAQLQRDSIQKAIKDSVKIANINELGEWKIGYFVDDFKELTGKCFVYQKIIGTFSNSATASRALLVTIQIYKDSRNDIEIEVRHDEYMNGVIDQKNFEWEKYGALRVVCYSTRKVYVNYRHCMVLMDIDTRKYTSLLDILKMGDKIEFKVKSGYSTRYNYTVEARHLENALLKAGIETLNED